MSAPAAGGDALYVHDGAFEQLIHWIPAKFYVPVDEEQMDTKYQKNTRTKTQKQHEAEERKAQSQAAKRAKLDPDNVKSVQEMQQDRRRRLEEGESLEFDGSDEEEEQEQEEDDHEVDDEVDDDDDDDDDDDKHQQEAAPAPDPAPRASSGRRLSATELRERLHTKIAMLHRKRHPHESDGEAPPSTKQELMEERRRQRGEMRDRRRRERKEARRQAKGHTSQQDARTKQDVSGSSQQAGLLVHDTAAPQRTAAAKPELDTRLNFSQVDFGLDTQRKNKYALPSDPKAALASLEARKRREEGRVQKQVDRGQNADQAREAAEEAQRWGKAMAAAEGVRIRDNERLLKQTIKRREKSKAKSAKAWNDRRRAEQEAQAAKQKKRMDNLAARREAKRSPGKSAKKPAKPAKARPGFEGSSRSFGSASTRKSSSGSGSSARPAKR